MTESVEIIAECEINHNGDVELAKQLIDAAKEAGASSIKFQCFKPASFIAPGSAFMPIFENVELSLEDFKNISKYAKSREIEMFSTAVDLEGLAMIRELDFPKIKIGSTNITNLGLLREIAATKKPVYLSTGASTLGEVDQALQILSAGTDDLTLFHCTALYPAPAHELNILSMTTLQDAFPQCRIAYSDHSMTTTAAIMAVALGARVLEKHFTLDNALPGPDHEFSAAPDKFAAYVAAVREAETTRGSLGKAPSASEGPIRLAGRRYITAMVDIPVGSQIETNMIRPRRIGIDNVDVAELIEAQDEDKLLNLKAGRNIPAHSSIAWKDLAQD